MTPQKPEEPEAGLETPPQAEAGASKAEQEVRHAPEITPREKRIIGAETSREEDA